MDQHQVRVALFKISLVALTASSWIFTSFVFGTRPDMPDNDTFTTLVRLPASLPGVSEQLPKLLAPQVKPMEPIRMDIVKLPCWDMGDMAEQSVAARWIRLTGKVCQTDAEPETIEISNLTNGYTGTVFQTHADQMSTDFIPLQEGANDILIRFGQGDGVALENRFVFLKAAAE